MICHALQQSAGCVIVVHRLYYCFISSLVLLLHPLCYFVSGVRADKRRAFALAEAGSLQGCCHCKGALARSYAYGSGGACMQVRDV